MSKRLDPRIQRGTASLRALSALLSSVIRSASAHRGRPIETALRSQSALARFSDDTLGITATTINSHKRAALHVFPRGFEDLDALRRAAREALAAASPGAGPAKKAIGTRSALRDLKDQLRIAKQDLWIYSSALKRSLLQARTYARESNLPHVMARCEKEQRAIVASIGLRSGEHRTNDQNE